MNKVEFSRPFAIHQLPKSGTARTIQATAEECQALATRLEIVEIQKLQAEMRLDFIKGGNYIKLSGRLQAVLVQECVVTLDPVRQNLDETFQVLFGPVDQSVKAMLPREVVLSLEDDDPPENIVDGQIDLGEVITQHLAIFMDPYPRRPDLPDDAFDQDFD